MTSSLDGVFRVPRRRYDEKSSEWRYLEYQIQRELYLLAALDLLLCTRFLLVPTIARRTGYDRIPVRSAVFCVVDVMNKPISSK